MTASSDSTSFQPRSRRRRTSLVATLLASALCACGCTGQAEVARVESQREANRIVALLLAYGLDDARLESKVDRRETTHLIYVAPESVDAARQILAAHGLPREATASESGGSLTPPGRDEERLRVASMMAERVRAELERLPGVTSASVLVSIPASEPLSLRQQPAATRISVVVQGFVGAGQSIAGMAAADFERLVVDFVSAADAAAPVVRVQLCPVEQGPDLSALVRDAREEAKSAGTLRTRIVVVTGAILALGVASCGFFVSRRRGARTGS